MDKREIIRDRIIEDLAEGVLTVGFDGVVGTVNNAALEILDKGGEELVGRSFANIFLTDERNDGFVQCVLDAIYERGLGRENYVSYQTERRTKQLRIVSSYLRAEDKPVGVVLVISDITELNELRDAVLAAEEIRRLNGQLELRNRVLEETFGRYMSDDIAREILKSPTGWRLGGQKRRITILMSDLRGFTALSERMAPKDLITMINHYFGEMYDQIERYRGTLVEFLGDGLLVMFGAPVKSGTHAADAVAAAIAMQRRMGAVNRWNAAHGYEPLAMGIGINTEEGIVGNIGSRRRTKYGVLGSAVNLAGRIESYTTGGQILISQSTREEAGVPLEIRQDFTVSPKGARGQILISDVTGIGAPYNLRLESVKSIPRPLARPARVRFGVLDGKQIRKSGLEGSLIALSGTEGVLQTGEALTLYEDICLELGEGLFAKVTELRDEFFRIAFTGKPPCFDAWAEGLLRGDGEAACGNKEE